MKMQHETTAHDEAAAWESGELGRDEDQTQRVSQERQDAIEAKLGLQMISIRLPREMLKHLKLIADFNGVGYQPLIRDVLSRFARSELRNIVYQMQNQMQAKAQEVLTENESPAAKFFPEKICATG
jgi:predicted DNA binding CopG/RHH family protein